jgi:hypothetical protein
MTAMPKNHLKQPFGPFKNILKKVKKKLVNPWLLPLNGNLRRQTA